MAPTVIKRYADMIEQELKSAVDSADFGEGTLKSAVEYALLGGGKRLRPALLLEFYRVLSGNEPTKNGLSRAMPFAISLEMIHSYSLVHDDLPCMDDDDYRRGRLSCHKKFGYAQGVLAGDALLNLALEVAIGGVCDEDTKRAASLIARNAGGSGMIAGQMMDMESAAGDLESLMKLQKKKTGALIEAACVCGAICANAAEKDIGTAAEYAGKLGLCFQIVDDILDFCGDPALLGKSTGKDEKQHKATFVTLFGVETAQKKAGYLTEEAVHLLSSIEGAEDLVELTRELCGRKH